MKIYLDIDGTLIHEELSPMDGKPAEGLVDFLTTISKHDLYWLTTHCTDGNPDRARSILKKVTDNSVHSIINGIKGTIWDAMKTDALDFSSDFIWFDDTLHESERKVLERCNESQMFIEMNLRNNPSQLIEITNDLF